MKGRGEKKAYCQLAKMNFVGGCISKKNFLAVYKSKKDRKLLSSEIEGVIQDPQQHTKGFRDCCLEKMELVVLGKKLW